MTPLETVREFIDRLCAIDFDGACELVTDDVEYDNVPMGKQFGPQGIRDLLGPLVGEGGPVEEMQFVVHREAATGDVVMNERTDRFRRGDQWVEVAVVGVFVVTGDGRISLWRDYFDLSAFQTSFTELMGGAA
jgi:limonene-1,2-epoxide hydrolase